MIRIKYFILAVICIVVSLAIVYVSYIESETRSIEDRFETIGNHTSVTFIMGTDKQVSNYYTFATEHFLYNQKEKTDLLINSCKTIADVIHFLNESELRGKKPWSVVNLVAHGNPNTGINLDLSNEGERATPKRMLQAVLIDSMPKLKAIVVDSSTKVNMWSCGIGKNPLITLSMERFFQPSNGDQVSVYCSPHFVLFKPDTTSNEIRRLSLSYWPYYYKRGYRPSDSEIVYELSKQFPSDSIDWEKAIEEGEDYGLFSQEYHIPVSYTKIYSSASDRPDLTTDDQQMGWLTDQQNVMDQIEEAGIPIDRFQWQVRKVIHTTKDGDKVPAVKAIGMATILNILKNVEV